MSEKPSARLPDRLPSEMRIALVMSGGIALTLYEAGVSHEIFRFYQAGRQESAKEDTFAASEDKAVSTQEPSEALNAGSSYAKAFEVTGILPVIDVLTGASAGGINSVFLASCVATGQDFGEFHDLWINTAGIQELRYGRGEIVRSLLNTKPLERAMTGAL